VEIFSKKILVIDSAPIIRNVLSVRLTALSYKVFLSDNTIDGLHIFMQEHPDLIVLDISLPTVDGYKLCRKIRKQSQIPIIFLTNLGGVSDYVTGLDVGADDYIVKPFSPKVLEARIRSIFRRVNIENQKDKPTNSFKVGDLIFTSSRQSLFKNNISLKLTDIEFRLFRLLFSNAGKTLSRKVILKTIWGYTPERDIDTRIVDVHIFRLRTKLEENSSKPELIVTVRGAGYRFQKY
jgi:OmpR family response regulator RpaB